VRAFKYLAQARGCKTSVHQSPKANLSAAGILGQTLQLAVFGKSFLGIA